MRSKSCFAAGIVLVASLLLVGTTFVVAQDVSSNSVTSTKIPSTLFGMSAHDGVLHNTVWPTMPIVGMRLWDSHVNWAQINTAKGVYDWSTLDSWVSKAASHNNSLVYTFGATPRGPVPNPTTKAAITMMDPAMPPAI